MKIFLVRHGDAVPEEDAGSDRDRWLSPRGREAARVLGRLLKEQHVEPDAILSSPLPRAVQTAELLAQTLDYLDTIVTRRSLEPSSHPRVASGDIMSAGGSVIVVSHEPIISALGAFLVGRPSFHQFRTAQCYALEDGKPLFSARADVSRVDAFFID